METTIDGLRLATERVAELNRAGQLASAEGHDLLIGIAAAALHLARHPAPAKAEGEE